MAAIVNILKAYLKFFLSIFCNCISSVRLFFVCMCLCMADSKYVELGNIILKVSCSIIVPGFIG